MPSKSSVATKRAHTIAKAAKTRRRPQPAAPRPTTSVPTAASSLHSTALTNEERRELHRLASLMPAVLRDTARGRDATDPTRIVQRATHYIQQLTATIVARVNSGTLPVEALQHLPPSVIAAPPTAHRRRRK